MQQPGRLIVGEGADQVRRAVGPTAWVALEVLAARSTTVDGERRVAASVRDVAATVGLSKNAAHRAIQRLVDAGFITPLQRRGDDGRFQTGTYSLMLPPHALRVEPARHSRSTGDLPRARATSGRSPSDCTGQLDLPAEAR